MVNDEKKCRGCGDAVDETTTSHWTDGPRGDGYGHRGLCCDCYDLRAGAPLDTINEERKARGAKPLREWTGDFVSLDWYDGPLLEVARVQFARPGGEPLIEIRGRQFDFLHEDPVGERMIRVSRSDVQAMLDLLDGKHVVDCMDTGGEAAKCRRCRGPVDLDVDPETNDARPGARVGLCPECLKAIRHRHAEPIRLMARMPLNLMLSLRWVPVLSVGSVWWCEDCGRGGFVPVRSEHRDWCPTRIQ